MQASKAYAPLRQVCFLPLFYQALGVTTGVFNVHQRAFNWIPLVMCHSIMLGLHRYLMFQYMHLRNFCVNSRLFLCLSLELHYCCVRQPKSIKCLCHDTCKLRDGHCEISLMNGQDQCVTKRERMHMGRVIGACLCWETSTKRYLPWECLAGSKQNRGQADPKPCANRRLSCS